jgi:hypothetical protein
VALVRNGLPDDIARHAARIVAAAGPAAEAMAAVDPRVPRGSKPHPGPRIVDSFQVGAGGASRRGTKLVIKAQNLAPHAEYTDKGTGPHEIRPRSARALRFDAGGGIVFAKRVQHPGNAPGRWFEPVMGQAWDRALASAVLLV